VVWVERRAELDKLGIAVVGIHPDAFMDSQGKPNMAKLEKLDKIIEWASNFASITTFDQWYKYTIFQPASPES
jgi:hypothetical protein